MNSNNTNKFRENNAELAKALVEHKKTIAELRTESSKYRCAYFDVYEENQLLKTQLNSAKKNVLDLFKLNTQNYTDVMRKLGIVPTNINNPSAKSTSSSARPNSVPKQRHSLDGVKRPPIGPKKIASEILVEKKDFIGSEQKPTTSTSQPTGDKPACGQPDAGLPSRNSMDRPFTVTTSREEVSMDIDQRGKDPLHESIERVPKVIIASHSDGGDGEELNISHALSENSFKRSPVGRKMNYDQEVNTSLRELKEKKSSEKLSPVPDESNRKRLLSPPIKSTVYNATKRSAEAHDIAQAQSIVNNVLCVPSLKYINNNLEEAKENEEIPTSKSFKSTLQKSAQRSPLQTIQSPNISQGRVVAMKHQKSSHSMERQSDDSHKRQVRRRTKSKENVSIDNEQPMNGRASKSRGDECYKSSVRTMEMQSDDSNNRRARTRTRSKENVSIDDEQPSCSERPRRLIATANYAEPKLNTKMRRKF